MGDGGRGSLADAQYVLGEDVCRYHEHPDKANQPGLENIPFFHAMVKEAAKYKHDPEAFGEREGKKSCVDADAIRIPSSTKAKPRPAANSSMGRRNLRGSRCGACKACLDTNSRKQCVMSKIERRAQEGHFGELVGFEFLGRGIPCCYSAFFKFGFLCDETKGE